MGLQEEKEGVLRKLGPQNYRPQTPKNSHPPGRLENTDPQFNIFQMSILLSTFNFQLTMNYIRAQKGGFRDTCAMSLYSLYH